MNRNGKFWTVKEDNIARSMTPAAAASKLGRTESAILDRLRLLASPDKAEAIRKRKQKYRRENYVNVASSPRVMPEEPIPDDVLADRARRLMIAPRDLTAAFFSDPLPGYSALDRREREYA